MRGRSSLMDRVLPFTVIAITLVTLFNLQLDLMQSRHVLLRWIGPGYSDRRPQRIVRPSVTVAWILLTWRRRILSVIVEHVLFGLRLAFTVRLGCLIGLGHTWRASGKSLDLALSGSLFGATLITVRIATRVVLRAFDQLDRTLQLLIRFRNLAYVLIVAIDSHLGRTRHFSCQVVLIAGTVGLGQFAGLDPSLTIVLDLDQNFVPGLDRLPTIPRERDVPLGVGSVAPLISASPLRVSRASSDCCSVNARYSRRISTTSRAAAATSSNSFRSAASRVCSTEESTASTRFS